MGELQPTASAGASVTAAPTAAASAAASPSATARRELRTVVIDVLLGGPTCCSGAVDDMGRGQGDAVQSALAQAGGDREKDGDDHQADARDPEPIEGHGGDERAAAQGGR